MDARERARQLEKAGKTDAAVKAYRELGLIDDAARVLGAARRQKEAADLLAQSLQVEAAQVGQLDATGKKRALMAAIFYGKAGENARAVELFVGLGEQARAVELLQRAGDAVGAARLQSRKVDAVSLLTRPHAAAGAHAISLPGAQRLQAAGKLDLALEAYLQLKRHGEAAACAKQLGRFADAAQLYADAGQPFEAAACHRQTGDTGSELENLVRVPRGDPRYPEAASRAIRLALELKAGVDFKLEHFLGAFAESQPRSPEDRETHYLLGVLYQQHDFAEGAREAFAKVGAYRDAADRLAELTLAPSDSMARRVLETSDLHKRARRAELPDLPSLDALPGLDGEATMLREPAAVARQEPAAVTLREGAAVTLPPEDLIPDAPHDASAAGAFAIGGTVGGRYLLEKKIGQGGMASVYRAHDLELDERVALKVFGLEQQSEMLVARFKQELKLSRQLQHPNIIRLYDLGLHQGHRYLSMELLRGASMKERMEQAVGFAEALDWLIQASAGLQAAHDAGVIHRDVKPDNLFVTDEGVVKVMDFGIAKQFALSGVTVAGSIAGTPLYMSPEQIGSFSTVTHQTDLYALGVCAYELFTGAPPFNHPELVPLLMMHVNEAPPPPRLKNPSIPADLEAAILRSLAKDPGQRFSSARAFGETLHSIRSRYA